MSDVMFDEDKETTLGEQIDMLIFSGDANAEKWQAFRRLLVSRIPGANEAIISTLPLKEALKLAVPLASVLKKVNDRYNINLDEILPKGSA